ncbi:hypothetical protein D3C87_667060 [compost metagenome]
MAFFSTGPIENNPVNGVRITQQLTIKIENRDSLNGGTVRIQGYVLDGTMTLYVLELFSINPSQVITKNYFADLDAFKFELTTGGTAADQIEISVWGKSASGEINSTHRLVSEELLEP